MRRAYHMLSAFALLALAGCATVNKGYEVCDTPNCATGELIITE